MTMPRWLVVLALALGVTATWFATRSDAATSSVSIKDFAFQPPELTVQVGDTVTWTNGDSEPHAVQGGPMDSPDIPAGGSFSHTFSSLGDVPYVCRIHTYMTGVVHVVDHAPPPSTTTTTAAPSTTTTTAAPTTTTTASGGSTTSTSAPQGSTSTTTAEPPPPPPSGGPGFQDVPDDPSAGHPPGSPGATTPPPTAPSSTTTTTSTTSPPTPPPAQEVPDDPDDGHPPGHEGGDPGGPGDPPPNDPLDLGDGTVLAPFEMDGDVKVFHLTMAPTTIETAPGVTKPAYAFNGTVPGPVLRVDEGDRVRFVVDNQLPVATGVHWHGMVLPNDQDGVPGMTQPFIEPGARYVYEWTAIATGTHWYHSHSSGRHIGKGLYGALEVVPKVGDFHADRDYRLLLGDSDLGFVLNGRMFPSTRTLRSKVGETVRIRVINAGDQVHAMHLHGIAFDVVAQDGNPMAVPLKMDTLTISPGQTFDLLAKEANPGSWLLHCHIFAHSHKPGDEHEHGDTGMTGMVTVLEVVPADTVLPVSPLATQPIASTSGARPGSDPSATAALWTTLALLALLSTAAATASRVRAAFAFSRSTSNRKELL